MQIEKVKTLSSKQINNKLKNNIIMKKIFVLLVAVFALGIAANAQDALGLRFGGGTKYGAEISYQKSLAANRLEFDLGVNLPDFDFFYLTGVYQWKGGLTDWLGWYAGPGAKVS